MESIKVSSSSSPSIHSTSPLLRSSSWFLILTSSQQGVNYVAESIQGTGAQASKEANKQVAKDSDASLTSRASAAKDAVGDKMDQTSHETKADVHKGKLLPPLPHICIECLLTFVQQRPLSTRCSPHTYINNLLVCTMMDGWLAWNISFGRRPEGNWSVASCESWAWICDGSSLEIPLGIAISTLCRTLIVLLIVTVCTWICDLDLDFCSTLSNLLLMVMASRWTALDSWSCSPSSSTYHIVEVKFHPAACQFRHMQNPPSNPLTSHTAVFASNASKRPSTCQLIC